MTIVLKIIIYNSILNCVQTPGICPKLNISLIWMKQLVKIVSILYLFWL